MKAAEDDRGQGTMSIDISPQLGSILARRQMTEDDLARQIRERFDLGADASMIARLARQDTLQNANVELAVAAARILGVSLDDLFRTADSPSPMEVFSGQLHGHSPEVIAALLDDQTYDDESPEGGDCVDSLLAEYGRTIYDRHLRDYADEHGMTIERAREVVMRDFVDTLHQYDATAASQVEELLIKQAREHRAQSGE